MVVETQLDKGSHFITHISGWIVTALWHSLVAFAFPCMALLSMSNIGQTSGIWTFGLSIYSTALFIVTIKLAIHIPHFTIYHIFSISFVLVIYIATIYFTSISSQSTYLEWININAQVASIFSFPSLWLFIALSPIAACLPDTTFQVFSKWRSPQDFQIMQEMEHGWQENIYVSHHNDYVEQLNDLFVEQIIEDEGIISKTNESLANEAIKNTLEEGGDVESDGASLGKLLANSEWERNVNQEGSASIRNNLFKNKNDYTAPSECVLPANQNTRVKYKFTEALRKSFNIKKDKKAIPTKQSAKPFEIIEALGITSEEVLPVEKSNSPWKNLGKHWSLTPTPQTKAPVQIKSPSDFQPKTSTRRNKKKILKANPAMSRLTRLASTKINISDLNLFSEDEDHFVDPVEHISQNYLSEMSSSLPFISNSKDEYWLHVDKDNMKSSIIPQSSEHLNAMELSNRDRPPINHPNITGSNRSHFGYSASKPKTLNFTMPLQALQPSQEKNLTPAQSSTIDHYSRLTSGPIYHDKTMKASKYVLDRMGNNMKQSRGSSFYDDDYDIEYDNENDISKNKNQDDEKITKKPFYKESRYQNLNLYHNEELEAYNSYGTNYLKTNLKEKQKTSKFPSSHNEDLDHIEDINHATNKEDHSMKDSYEQTNQLTSMPNENQPMYRRISASGHVSLIKQSNPLDLPPHESPFADYTKHGLNKETLEASVSGDLLNVPFENNNEFRLLKKERKVDNNEPLQPLSPQVLEAPEPLKIEPMTILEKNEFEQNSSENVSKEINNKHSIVEVLLQESSFTDYSKHGIREYSPSKDHNEDSNSQFVSPNFNEDEKLLNTDSVKLALHRVISNYIVHGRSPWASETGDPSHSITPSLEIPILPSIDHTIAIAQPNVNVDIPNVIESNITTNNVQRSSITSRVSLYSRIDVPTYKQALEVVPHRTSKIEQNF